MLRRKSCFSAGIATLLAVVGGCNGSGGLTGGGGTGSGGSSGGPSANCAGDPDNPSNCTYWTCMNVPTPFGNKTHCTSPQPPGAPHPGGDYTCTSGIFCPGGDVGGSGPWQCHADDTGLTCDRGGGGGGSGGGWMCTSNPDGSQTCTNPNCTQLPSGEFGCSNGSGPVPPGPTPPGGWTCTVDEFGHEVCTSPPGGGSGMGGTGGGGGGSGGGGGGGAGGGGGGGGSAGTGGSGGGGGAPPGSNCPTAGQQRWCDGLNFCSWGKQICVNLGISWQWGPCVEGNPNNPPNPAPNTPCACYYPYSYNPQCCERPDCIVVGERQVPCGTVNGGVLCAPCGTDSDCAAGNICVRKLHYVPDTPNGGGNIGTVEQFCSHSCNTAGDCGATYNCIQPSGSPLKFCAPQSGTCVP